MNRKQSANNDITYDYFFNIDTELTVALKYLQFVNETENEI